MTVAAPGVYGLQIGAGDGSPRSVLRVNDRATIAGNVAIEVGHQNRGGHGWAKTEHVVVTPDELPGLLAELAEHWLTANPDATVTLALDDDEAGDVHHALSIAVSLIRQVGIQPGGGLTEQSEERMLRVARRLSHERRWRGSVPNPNAGTAGAASAGA